MQIGITSRFTWAFDGNWLDLGSYIIFVAWNETNHGSRSTSQVPWSEMIFHGGKWEDEALARRSKRHWAFDFLTFNLPVFASIFSSLHLNDQINVIIIIRPPKAQIRWMYGGWREEKRGYKLPKITDFIDQWTDCPLVRPTGYHKRSCATYILMQ